MGAQNSQPLFAMATNRTTSPIPSLRQLFTFYSRIPCPPPNQSMAFLYAPDVEDYILSHCDRTMKNLYFKPSNNAQMRQVFLSRLNSSSFTRWVTLLYIRIHESYLNGDTLQNQARIRWIEDIEHALRTILAHNPEPHEAQDRLGDWLGVLLLRLRMAHISSSYTALRNATPTFLQLAFSDPNLWPADSDSTSIPLTSTIISPRHELANFVLVDSVCSMAFGLPQQVEYDTSLGASPLIQNQHESLLSFPTEFQVTLTEINACRDASSTARDWREIEHRLMTWEAQSGKQDSGWESWMVVAWLAVQESWRHTLLTYLYMAACGASSDDPRVQSSVCQIFRVTGTVKKQESSEVGVPFFVQYLMAGICARSEKHRKIAREQLLEVSESKIWLMSGVDFVPVLDHLWHGAAANGQPIKWSDYMRSRETMLPVVT
ncbi:transcriptional regulatory protein [Ceratobasidium theobromae]|uniref:Transcriptional regulatory protein n=1 Tax=Ceratobasidium theobromae TaxID=1582974 RepID=A0A5N5QJ92_9AGAM|nr:transcriptional regulatory protein [Ceratobasidium theobromae]